jgi:alpha-glucoside transport system substrate-binding protein
LTTHGFGGHRFVPGAVEQTSSWTWDEDMSAFEFPGSRSGERSMLVDGDFVVALVRNEAVEAVRLFLASQEYHETRLRLGTWASSRQGIDSDLAPDPVDAFATEALTDADATIRFSVIATLPEEARMAAFEAMTRWVDGELTSAEALAEVESAWP